MYFKTMFEVPIINYSIGIVLRIRKGFTFKLIATKKPTEKTLGITSYCKDGQHVLFFDFDGNELNEICFQLQKLQEYYNLSEMHIFENDRPKSFHAICLDKQPLFQTLEIIKQTTADNAFKYAPLRYALKKWVLRVAAKGTRQKPKYLFDLKPYNTKKFIEKSNAHRLFLNLYYGLKIKNDELFDNEKELDCYEYRTAQRI